MPHHAEHREIIRARVGRAAPPAALSQRSLAPHPVNRTAYSSRLRRSDAWRYSTIHNRTLDDTSREPLGSIWRLFVSAIQGSTSRFACPLRPETVSNCLCGLPQPPQSGLLRCHCGDEPCPKSGTTPSSLVALQQRSQGDASPGSHYIGVPYLGTTFGDSEDEGFQRCRHRLTPDPTCGPSTSRRHSALPQEPCVDGESMAWDPLLSRRAGLCGTGRKTWRRGRKRLTEESVLENADTASLPCRGERRAGSKLRRGSAHPRSASHTVHPTSREVPVTPTLARWCPQWAPAFGSGQITSDLISTPMGPR